MPTDRVTQVRLESERLTQCLRTLPPDAWSRPSACDGWEVQDVVAHLTAGAEFLPGRSPRDSRETQRRQGDASPLALPTPPRPQR